MGDRDELHQSDLSCLQMCAEQYRRRRNGDRGYRSCPLVCGGALHVGRAVNLTQKVQTGEDLPLEAVTEATRDNVVQQFNESPVQFDEELKGLKKSVAIGQIIDRSVEFVKADFFAFQVSMKPVAVEHSIGVHLPKYPFDIGMKLDEIDPGDVIRDAKSSSKKPDPDVAEKSQQFAVYSLGYQAEFGRLPSRLQYDYSVRRKNKTVETVDTFSFWTTPNEAWQQAVLNRLAVAYEAIQKGIFVPCDASHWLCSSRWCEFYDGYDEVKPCRYANGKTRPKT